MPSVSVSSRVLSIASLAAMLVAGSSLPALAAPAQPPLKGHFSNAVAMDVSPALRSLAAGQRPAARGTTSVHDIRPERGATISDTAFRGDGAVQSEVPVSATIGAPLANFDGLSNQDNSNIFGFRVNPPDPVGDVGPNHYVEMVNLVFAVYSKTGTLLVGPADTGILWTDFAVPDCTDASGDPIVVYDQLADRWILSQFTTRGFDPATPTAPFYNCVAVSTTGDPTGTYYRYAFITQPDLVDGGYFFPDYPKYGVWTDSYVLTTRDFGFDDRYGISVYGLEKNKMLNGLPARAVQFFLDSDVYPLNLIGDGLLPADIDGKQKPMLDAAIPIVGTQDDGAGYGATFDAINIWEFSVKWRSTPTASLALKTQLPVAGFDSIFPCGVTPSTTPGFSANSRDCLPQPGVIDGSRYLDILSYRQRPTWRLAYRNFKGHETLVTNQSVEAAPGVAGVRWYEVRRVAGTYSVYQQGTYAPGDGVHRWMGSVAQDKKGNLALGFSVVNGDVPGSGTEVYPGIRYTGRLAGDALGTLPLGEGVMVNGSGVQTTTNSRWGDYTSLNVDPLDDCTFWYVNEYYTAASQASSPAGWLTRIGSFKLPGC